MEQMIQAFHAVSKLRRDDLFDDTRLMPITATDDARTPACGWVGRQWHPGSDVLIGINPGGGGDNYRCNPTDDRLYGLLRAFRDSEGAARGPALASLSAAWIDIQRGHNIWRLISALLNATGRNVEQCAFLNILPFRTRMDQPAPLATIQRAIEKALRPQLAALRPGRVFTLGLKAHNALKRLGDIGGAELIALRRTIGDSYIAPATQATLQVLAEKREDSQ